MIGGRDIARANSYASDDIRKISLDKIIIREGFNSRRNYGDIKALSQTIIENGQIQPGRVDVLADGMFALVDGHRRLQALQLLQSEGNECYFLAIVNKSKTTEEQRLIQMFATQDNKQLEPVEAADNIQRLANLGHKQKDIARKIGRPASYVSQMLAIAIESPLIKKHIEDGDVKVSAVLKVQKSTPNVSERVAKIEAAVTNSKKNATNGLSNKSKTSVTVSKELSAPEKNKKVGKIVSAIIKDARIKAIECMSNWTADAVLTEVIGKYL